MALLGTYLNAGAACLAVGVNCFLHALPTVPDFATFIPTSGSQTSLPNLATRQATTVQIVGAAAIGAEALFATFNAIIR